MGPLAGGGTAASVRLESLRLLRGPLPSG